MEEIEIKEEGDLGPRNPVNGDRLSSQMCRYYISYTAASPRVQESTIWSLLAVQQKDMTPLIRSWT